MSSRHLGFELQRLTLRACTLETPAFACKSICSPGARTDALSQPCMQGFLWGFEKHTHAISPPVPSFERP